MIPDNNLPASATRLISPRRLRSPGSRSAWTSRTPIAATCATLTTPWGTVIELHPKGQGGNAADLKVTYDETTLPAVSTLRGRGTQGTWRLAVQDLASADTGRLNRWSLEFSAAAAADARLN